MGDRFYMQQKKDMGTRWRTDGTGKGKRRLKAHVITDITDLLGGQDVPGLDAMTVANLEALKDALVAFRAQDLLGFGVNTDA